MGLGLYIRVRIPETWNLKRELVCASFWLLLLFGAFEIEFEFFEISEFEFSKAGNAKISEGPSSAPPLRSSSWTDTLVEGVEVSCRRVEASGFAFLVNESWLIRMFGNPAGGFPVTDQIMLH